MDNPSHLNQIIKYSSPPFLIDLAKRLRSFILREGPEWEFIPEGWARAQSDSQIKGWNVESVLEAYQAKWSSFVRQLQTTSPLGVSPESLTLSDFDLAFHNTMMVYAYAFALAAHQKTSLSMLDWGGGIGHYYLISQALIPGLEIEYHCKDVPVLVDYGRQLFPQAHFYTDESCLMRRYDFVLASTSLHYAQDWASTLSRLVRATSGYMLVTQLPIVHRSPSFVFVQRPYKYGYNTEYLGWCLNRIEFLRCAEQSGLKLIREFVNGPRPLIAHAPEACQYQAFLFRWME